VKKRTRKANTRGKGRSFGGSAKDGPDGGCRFLGDHIVIAPGVCGGRPTFKGTRVEVQVVLDWLREGRSISEILRGYPTLSRDGIEEAIGLAAKAFSEQYTLEAA
jgi:uncharacterized protein (DUF433 family)